MDVLTRPAPQPDHHIAYGNDASQFGELWLPEAHGSALLPLVVFFHGGWWQSSIDLRYAGHLGVAFKRDGIACWSLEYRRVGETGGGWPTTFQDAAHGFDFAAELAKKYPIDTKRVIVMGHSAGGHLAFWIAGRHHIDPHSEIYQPRPQVPLRGAISLAGAVDLRKAIELAVGPVFAHDREEVYSLMGGGPEKYPDRYKAGDPGELLPFNIPQILLQGTEDDQIPPGLPAYWAERAKKVGDTVTVSILRGVDHLDVSDPASSAWPAVLQATRQLLKS